VDYAKRAAKLVEIRDPDGAPPHEPSTWIFDHWIDTCEDPRVTAARLREKIAAELQAAHDAGVAERAAEVAALRQIISDAAREVGAQVSPECSLDFMALLPREIALAIRRAEGGR